MALAGALRTRPRLGALVGFAGVTLVNAFFIIVDPHVTRAIPLLLLMVPVTLSSVIGGWRASAPVAFATGLVYSFAFVAPTGVVRIGLTEDTVTLATFVLVAFLVSALSGLGDRNQLRREQQRAVMLRSVSHDLRNPLNAIRAASTELRDELVYDPATRTRLLELMINESDRLDRIVANLLSMSRIEAGALTPELVPESLDDLVRTSVARLERTIGDRRVIIDIPDDLPEVSVDRTQFDQVITNLVENALRHAPMSPTVEIGAADVGTMVEVRVTDHGRGFSPAARSGAFEFFRPAGPTGVHGVGLGVCRAIIEAHGGTIIASDVPGGGARISFTIPKAG